MPRQARKKSKTNIYHIMLRGINQQIIFEDHEDYERFIKTLAKYQAISGYSVYAYCLMSNHIHLLIKEGKENLEQIIKRIAGSYVYWYNWKYNRSGHLFQDRFKSEPVETDEYFLTVIRYIHQNPVKAKVTTDISKYEFSSYTEYLRAGSAIVDKEFVYSIIDKTKFIEFNLENNDDICLDIEEQNNRITDSEAKEIIKQVCGYSNASEIQKLDIAERNKCVKVLKESGLSIRQISRITGVSKYAVEHA